MNREEGHYTIKRVRKLPKRGSGNYLYTEIKDNLSIFYRWIKNGEYEKIDSTNTISSIQVIEAGEGVSITGSGTEEDPFVITGSEQDNYSRTITVTSEDLSGIEGETVEDKIVVYINNLNYNKTETDSDMHILYEDIVVWTMVYKFDQQPIVGEIVIFDSNDFTELFRFQTDQDGKYRPDTSLLSASTYFFLGPQGSGSIDYLKEDIFKTATIELQRAS